MTDLLKRLSNGVTESDSIDAINELLVDCYNEILELRERIEGESKTEPQNNSQWLYLTMLADELNNKGIDQVAVLDELKKRPTVDLSNTKDSLYRIYWRGVRKALFPDAKRTGKKQAGEIYEAMNRHTASVFGVSIPWPDKYGQEYEKGR